MLNHILSHFSPLELTSTSLKMTPQMNKLGFITFQLSTEDVETEREVPAYTLLSLLSDLGGNIGIFTGISFFGVFIPKQHVTTGRAR